VLNGGRNAYFIVKSVQKQQYKAAKANKSYLQKTIGEHSHKVQPISMEQKKHTCFPHQAPSLQPLKASCSAHC
jgi:hypothetical protein